MFVGGRKVDGIVLRVSMMSMHGWLRPLVVVFSGHRKQRLTIMLPLV